MCKRYRKLTEKAILDYKGDIRNIYVFFCIVITKDTRLGRFRNLVDYCVDRKIVSARDADDVIDQFTKIKKEIHYQFHWKTFLLKTFLLK